MSMRRGRGQGMERKGEEGREQGQESRRRREQAAPFHSESVTPGCYQVTVGRSLE